jgi:2-keto-3-deoxy-galactonokinase
VNAPRRRGAARVAKKVRGRSATNASRASVRPPDEFGELASSTLASLIFELASQLHIERTRRLALEAALASRGLVSGADIEAASERGDLRTEAAVAADRSIRKLLRILSESDDRHSPLRAEAPTAKGEM